LQILVIADMVIDLTGGFLNGKKFINKESNSNRKKLFKNTIKDFDYETVFANTAKRIGLELEDKSEKHKEVLKLLGELKECEDYLLKNLDKIQIDSGDESQVDTTEEKSLTDLNSNRITLEKLNNKENMPFINKQLTLSNTNKDSPVHLINSIASADPDSNFPDKPIGRIEDISPFDFKKDLLKTTNWSLYYSKLSAISLFVRDKTHWPYFNQVFMISAKMNEGVQDLKRYLFTRARPGNWVFHRNFLTDQMPQVCYFRTTLWILILVNKFLN
jgi:hypothetical protein